MTAPTAKQNFKNFDEYQKIIEKYDSSELTHDLKKVGFIEKVLGLSGEAGEVTDKFKKILRDKDGKITDEDRHALVKELGDVLWYVASVARYLGVPFSEVVSSNVEKLEDRYQRNKIHGSGDER